VHTCHCRPTGRPNNKGCDRLNEINKTSSHSQTMRTNGVVAGMQEENFAPSGTPATPSKFWFSKNCRIIFPLENYRLKMQNLEKKVGIY